VIEGPLKYQILAWPIGKENIRSDRHEERSSFFHFNLDVLQRGKSQ
jgi:hypothetical protein